MTTIAAHPIVAAPVGANRLFAAGSPSFTAHGGTFGALPAPSSGLIGELETSGLSGRGGAGFATWRKLAATRARGAAAPVLIANGAEGEPLSSKDATLLRTAPHLVIDGLLVSAEAVGATSVYLYCGLAALTAVAQAISERPDAASIQLAQAPDTFISGEASAVVSAIENGRALPRDHPLRLSVSGLDGRPTLVQNVETLAHIALIARFGADWFRSVGTADEPGTRLLTVTHDRQSRVFEAAGGITVSDALRAGGVNPDAASAVLVGGYHGGWVPSDSFDLPLSRDALAPFGASPGAGILMTLSTDRCGLGEAATIARYLAAQTARQCGPCVNGLPQMAETLTRLAIRSREPSLPAELHRLCELVTGRGTCHHPDGTARMVLSALNCFAQDVEAHLRGQCVGAN